MDLLHSGLPRNTLSDALSARNSRSFLGWGCSHLWAVINHQQSVSLARFMQDSYRAELQGAVTVTGRSDSDWACTAWQTLTLDNKAAVNYGPLPPTGESADIDL